MIRPRLLARLFGRANGFQKAQLSPWALQVRSGEAVAHLPLRRLDTATAERGRVWSRILVRGTSGGPLLGLYGLGRNAAARYRAEIEQARQDVARLCGLLAKHERRLSVLDDWLRRGEAGDHWVAQHAVDATLRHTEPLAPVLAVPAAAVTGDERVAAALSTVAAFRDAPSAFRARANEVFVAAELARFREFFDTAEKHPLTDAQRLAVITHEDNTRVIAGAGSGKTSVLAVKAAYLLKKGLCTPAQLLLVAFNKRAAKELGERAGALAGKAVEASTFHSLGLSIIGRATGRKPTLAKTAEDEKALRQHLRELIAEVVRDPEAGDYVREYFQSFFAPYKDEKEFNELGEYYDHLQAFDLRSLQDERLRSFAEVEIANFLFLNGVRYQYEAPYAVDLATAEHRQYQPDFYLPDHDIYIEHFGIGRDGRTAPYIDRERYHQEMAWKRAVHAEHGTTLIETYSYLKQEGCLTDVLKQELRDHGVALRPISNEQLLEVLTRTRQIDPFTELVATFLNHFKGNGCTLDGVRAQARQRGCDTKRLEAFLAVFEPVYLRYQRALAASGEVDFNDMIIEATRHVREGSYRSPATCILVDEFQDISAGRAALIKALADQDRAHRLFCVGDDWQAIYRFAGSDIALMRDFAKHFGFTETVTLGETFRFNDRIERVASRFVQRNPAQLPKTIRCATSARGPRIHIHRHLGGDHDPFLEALGAIASQAGSGSHDVLVLGRYHKALHGWAWDQARRQYPALRLAHSTVHAAKGTEADYVIVVGLIAGRYGFPSQIADDPLLEAVLSEPEAFPHSEERRLFYVALTRARHAVHLIADYVRPSAFVGEIAADRADVDAPARLEGATVYCPDCGTGLLLRRTGRHGDFYGCSHYPLCKHISGVCRRCDEGAFVRREGEGAYLCSNASCGHRERICPRCGTGRLTERQGRYGPFLGCTNFASGDCNYTTNIAPEPSR
ncbi:UvrD-helicase domain-containing protein [Thiohalocapsa halophila]|uniref:UvrD-helicase domain-containing protein n=1 Tax=Thiohalocapsa halophila TaxID=69359 RepID=UPI001903B2DF|nr:UvrD-helicase domain-containing protein [Thiohalocapsa halophila]